MPLLDLFIWSSFQTTWGATHDMRFDEILEEKTVSPTFYEIPVLFLQEDIAKVLKSKVE